MPLPTTRVIPDGWSQHHRPTATATMTATCTITRTTGDGTTGPDGTWTPGTTSSVYDGPCRVTALQRPERLLVVGEDAVRERRYDVAVRYDTNEVHVDDVLQVTKSKDAGLVGLQFRVVDVRYDSEQWERILGCEEIEAGP
jgi:hypothetical protein